MLAGTAREVGQLLSLGGGGGCASRGKKEEGKPRGLAVCERKAPTQAAGGAFFPG